MTLESNLNPNDIDPPPRIMGSLVLIHAVSGLCCGVFGLIQMAQPDFFATQLVPGYEGPDVPQAIKLVCILAMAPLPLLLIFRALLAALGLILGVLTKEANIDFQLEMYEAMEASLGPGVLFPSDPQQVEQSYNFGLLVALLLGLAAPIGVGLWLMGGRGTRLQERLDMWRVATGGRP